MKKIMLAMLLLVNGCFDGGCAFCGINPRPQGTPDFVYHGISVYNHTEMTWDNDYFLNGQDRIRAAIDTALDYWNGSPDDLNGYTIEIVQERFKCQFGKICLGETTKINKTIKIAVNGVCSEYIPLPHEVGHALQMFGDPTHEDLKFHRMNSAFEKLIGKTYGLQNYDCHNDLEQFYQQGAKFNDWDADFGIF